MRKFSELEKKVINKILDLHSKCQTNCAYNVFFDLNSDNSAPSLYGLTPGFDLKYNGTNYEFFIDSNVHSQSDFQKIFFGLITDFYEFVFLMDYLVNNYYIALAEQKQSPSKSHDGYIPTSFLATELQEKITKYFSCYFYPTNKLYDMVEHDFLDLEGQEKYEEKLKQNKLEDEQKKLEKTQRRQFNITTVIAFASLISSVVAIIVPIINEKKHNDEKQKIELFISDENNAKLPISIENEDQLLVDINNVVHVEENNPKKIPLDVNVNINYPKDKK